MESSNDKNESKPLDTYELPMASTSTISATTKRSKKAKSLGDEYFSFKKYIMKMKIKPPIKISRQSAAILDELLQHKLREILNELRDIRKLSKQKTLLTQDLEAVIRLVFTKAISKMLSERAKKAVLNSKNEDIEEK